MSPNPFPGEPVDQADELAQTGTCGSAVHLVGADELIPIGSGGPEWINCERTVGHFGSHVARVRPAVAVCYDELGDVVEPLIVWADSDEPHRSAAHDRPTPDGGWDAG